MIKFKKGLTEPGPDDKKAYWFIYGDGKILVDVDPEDDTHYHIPCFKHPEDLNLTPIRKLFLGVLDSIRCFAIEVAADTRPPAGKVFYDRRRVYNFLEPDMFQLSGYAGHLLFWDRDSVYCGRCGTKTLPQQTERAKRCPACNLIKYPRLSPAVIVAVLKDGKILLGKHKRFSVMYSVLAGFVEPGETVEECIHREIKEEAGIEVKNICYFGSQPWPFPDSLMLGFTAEHAGGEIKVDVSELEDARWFSPSELPNRPIGKISIAGRLIDWFVSTCKD